uniref:Non-specific lipid-transfer protein 2-like n=1 Tax=Rhizophora mucronata TaxID=61149 RepID=A0A2P2IHR6_RHIMU
MQPKPAEPLYECNNIELSTIQAVLQQDQRAKAMPLPVRQGSKTH